MTQAFPTKGIVHMDFKDSPIGTIPQEWSIEKLIHLSVNGISNGVFRDPKKVGSGYRLINVYDMYQGFGVDINTLELLQIDEKEFVRNRVLRGDLFFTRSSLKLEGIAYCNINLSDRDDITFDGHLMRVRPDKQKVLPVFLAYYCLSDSARKFFMSAAKHSTMTTVGQKDIAPLPVPVPPIKEQQKIASILTAVDEVIEKTEAQICKLQDLKKGMMQELLTKGIGHTEFKDSPVGRIPKEWDAVLLDSVSIRGSGHTPSKSYPEYWNGGIRWVSLSDSNKLDRLYISESSKEISQTGLDNSSAVLHPEGTVILSRDAGVGKSAIIVREMAVSQHFIAWRCGEQLDNHYLYYLLQYWKPRFEGIAMGSTIQTIGLSYFKKLLIPLPPVNEQKTISKVFLSTDKRIFEIEKKLHQIKSLKKALMQDLLMGKVRVNVK